MQYFDISVFVLSKYYCTVFKQWILISELNYFLRVCSCMSHWQHWFKDNYKLFFYLKKENFSSTKFPFRLYFKLWGLLPWYREPEKLVSVHYPGQINPAFQSRPVISWYLIVLWVVFMCAFWKIVCLILFFVVDITTYFACLLRFHHIILTYMYIGFYAKVIYT